MHSDEFLPTGSLTPWNYIILLLFCSVLARCRILDVMFSLMGVSLERRMLIISRFAYTVIAARESSAHALSPIFLGL